MAYLALAWYFLAHFGSFWRVIAYEMAPSGVESSCDRMLKVEAKKSGSQAGSRAGDLRLITAYGGAKKFFATLRRWTGHFRSFRGPEGENPDQV